MKSVTSGHIMCEFMQVTPAYADEVMCCSGDGVRKLSDPSLLKERAAKNTVSVHSSESAVSASPQRHWLFVRPQEIK